MLQQLVLRGQLPAEVCAISSRPSQQLVGIIAKYSTSQVVFQALSILALLAQTRLLAPEELGLWNVLKLLPMYAAFAHLGMRDGMLYVIPEWQVRRSARDIRLVVGTVLFGSLLPTLCIALGIGIWSYAGPGMDRTERLCMAITAGIVVLAWLYENRLVLLKATQCFDLLISQLYLRSLLVFVLGVGLMLLFGVTGLVTGTALVYVVLIGYIRRKGSVPKAEGFSMPLAWKLMKIGLPIMTFEVMITFMRTLNRVVISSYLGNEQLGYYSIGIMAVTALTQYAGAAREIIEPRLVQALARGETEVMERYFFKPLINTAAYIPLLVGPTILCTPLVMHSFLPQYIPGIDPARVLCLSIYFLSLVFVFRGIIVAMGWQLRSLPVMAAALALNIGCSLFALERGWGLPGVATAVVASFFLLYAGLAVFLTLMHRESSRSWVWQLSGALLPFCFMMALLLMAEWIAQGIPVASISGAAVRCAVFLLGAVGANLVIKRIFPLADDIWTLLQTRGRG